MRFTTESEPLGKAAAFAARHASGSTPLPALAGLRISASGDGVRLAGYDYEAGSTVDLTVPIDEPGEILVPGRVFAEVLQSLPGGAVELSASGSVVEIRAGGIEFGLPTLPLEDYPTLPSAPAALGQVRAEPFATAAAQLAKAAMRDDTLPVLAGALFEFEASRLNLSASDRYRIALVELPWSRSAGLGGDLPERAIVPAKLLADTAKGLDHKGELSIGVRTGTESLLSLSDSQRTTTMRLVDGKYPDLRAMVPTTFIGAVTVAVDDLRAALRRVCIVADRYSAVVLTITDGELVVGAAGDVDTRGRERLSCTLEGDGTTTAFNAGYLLDGLDAVGTTWARLRFHEGIRAALLTGRKSVEEDAEDEPGFRYVVLPRRLPG
ncbi:DNA polymerase III subunit beta [Flindersiella endophytica]